MQSNPYLQYAISIFTRIAKYSLASAFVYTRPTSMTVSKVPIQKDTMPCLSFDALYSSYCNHRQRHRCCIYCCQRTAAHVRPPMQRNHKGRLLLDHSSACINMFWLAPIFILLPSHALASGNREFDILNFIDVFLFKKCVPNLIVTLCFRVFPRVKYRSAWISMEPRRGYEDKGAHLEDPDKPKEVCQQEQEAQGARRLRD